MIHKLRSAILVNIAHNVYKTRNILCIIISRWIDTNAKLCPKCTAKIQKIHGCNKMMCTQCRSHFCWLCDAPISRMDPYAHFRVGNSRCAGKLFEGLQELNEEDFFFWFSRYYILSWYSITVFNSIDFIVVCCHGDSMTVIIFCTNKIIRSISKTLQKMLMPGLT